MPRGDDSGGGANQAWNLESFLDSLVLELDKAQNTLALKAVNRKLTYTVKDVALDLQIFPSYDGDNVKFTTARPGQQGASKLSVQLGSITDTLIREVTRAPEGDDDLPLEAVDIDAETKSTLKKMGIHTTKDFERVQKRNIDVGQVAGKKLDYRGLADRINQARRRAAAPMVQSVSFSLGADEALLRVRGQNLAPMAQAHAFPQALLGEQPARVVSVEDHELCLACARTHLEAPEVDLKIALDPFAVLRMRLAGASGRDEHERQTA
jgi:hypothetical protein